MRSPWCSLVCLPLTSSSVPFTMVHEQLTFVRKNKHGTPPTAEAAMPVPCASTAQTWKCSPETMARLASLVTKALKKSSCSKRPTFKGPSTGHPTVWRWTSVRRSCGKASTSSPSAKVHANDHRTMTAGEACASPTIPWATASCCTGACTASSTGAGGPWSSCACAFVLRSTCGSALWSACCSGASRMVRKEFTTSTNFGR
mmetsp:Transcript_33137/g.104943  ORF Transcript_33137/g.104943 Transcript_33137/m.104943 type:complete len:201 (-) Transcript_33137:409-1011(-)